MKKTILSIATIIGLTAAGAAVAQDVTFESVDTDGDGQVSFEELQTILPAVTQEDFAILDQDGSGALSPDEFNVLLTPPAAPAEPAPMDAPMDAPMEPAPMDEPIQ